MADRLVVEISPDQRVQYVVTIYLSPVYLISFVLTSTIVDLAKEVPWEREQ
jgi:hypothetical protein